MDTYTIEEIRKRQRDFFTTHATKEIAFRKQALHTLHQAIVAFEGRLTDAVFQDLHKSRFEFYASEIGLVLDEIRFHLKKLKKWARPRRVSTPITHFKSRSYIYPEPFGQVLIIAPWNYPFNLLINPLVGALSAGNTAVLKPSPYTPSTSRVIKQMISDYFDPELIAVFEGGREVNEALLDQPFDLVFFTGSPALGKVVMEKASRHLAPVILELGGKSPCIVENDANLDLAARRITWGKFLNAGQTCIAPDYLFVHKDIKDRLLDKMKAMVGKRFSDQPQNSPDYPRIVNDKSVSRLSGLMNSGTLVCGGAVDAADRYIAPTIIDDIQPEDPIMQEEIFGPILPVMTYTDLDEAIAYINSKPKPLAFYLFTENKDTQKRVLRQSSSGGAVINDVIMHVANHHLPFGGVGNSGMGRYHGKFSFDGFSNQRAVINTATSIDIPLRYAPYRKNKLSLVKLLLR